MNVWPFLFIDWCMSLFERTGRRITVTESGSAPSHLNQTTHTVYDAENRVIQTWGATYPVAYDYDEFGRMTALHTWRELTENGHSCPLENLNSADTTRWIYDPASGLLIQKLYADNKGPSYSYTPDGKLATRTWARGIVTSYTYDSSGNLTNIDYDDTTTPSVSFTYDRMGRQLSAITHGVVTNLYAYSTTGQLLIETSLTSNDTTTLTRSYDTLGRSIGYMLDDGHGVTYGYDAFGRFETVTSLSPTATIPTTYTRLPGTDLINGLTYNTIGHQWERIYETSRNLISSVQTHHNSTLLASYDYANDAIGRRTSISRNGSLYDAPVQDHYGYNERSEVTSSRRYLHHSSFIPPHSEEVPGFAYDYAYDAIGNRITATEYDHENQALISNYTSNELNQYEERTVPGYAAVRGVSDPGTFVTVNDNPAAQTPPSGSAPSHFYGGDYVDNTQSPVLHPLSITAALPANAPQQLLTVNSSLSTDPDLTTTETRSLFVPQTPELFEYDEDGNLLADGRFAYTWDAENRLIRVETHRSAIQAGVSAVRVENFYDSQYRRIGKSTYTFTSAQTWLLSEIRSYLYDKWNVTRETIFSSNYSLPPVVTHYTWGPDFRRGDVDGLKLVIHDNKFYIPVCDANGNINGYANLSGIFAACYEYSPFGNIILQYGELAEIFSHRFSGKVFDWETSCYYYGYRFYSPNFGRWINRDLIDERGGMNLYGFCANRPIVIYDYLGLVFKDPEEVFWPLEDIERDYGEGTWGYTMLPEITELGDDEISAYIGDDPEKCYCAGINKAKTIDVFVKTILPSENFKMTKNGLTAAYEHERRRQKVYRLGYDKFLAPSQGTEKHVIRCPDICSDQGGVARGKLQKYLDDLRAKARQEYFDYWSKEQTKIHDVENDVENQIYLPYIEPLLNGATIDMFAGFLQIRLVL